MQPPEGTGRSKELQLVDGQLQRGALKGAMKAATQRAFGRHAWLDARVRTQPGYDHSYYFVSTFIPDHLAWHAEKLGSTCQGLRARS